MKESDKLTTDLLYGILSMLGSVRHHVCMKTEDSENFSRTLEWSEANLKKLNELKEKENK